MNTAFGVRREATPVAFSRVEETHLIEDVTFDADRTVVRARSGPWSRLPDGRSGAGSLGVLVDNALGYDAGRWAPADGWIVTREIRVDYLGDVPGDRQLLTATGTADRPLGSAGFGFGEVLDAAGRVIARTTDWVRYGSPFPQAFAHAPLGSRSADLPFGEPNTPGGPACAPDALTAVSGTWAADPSTPEGHVLDVLVDGNVLNEAGSLHGGIVFAAAVLCAELVLAEARPEARVTSAHVVHVGAGRPGEQVRFVPQVPHLGRSAQLVQVNGIDSAGRLVTTATVTSQS